MKRYLLSIALLCSVLFTAQAQLSSYDLNAPFGWAVCTSMTSGDNYELTGGGEGSSITLSSDGSKDMRSDIIDAIENYDVIIFDGSKGDFVVSSTMSFKDISDKTIVGINNAHICTQFYVTPEITAKLDEVGVRDMSSSGGGGTLSNGSYVAEEREFYTRQTLIDLLDDEKEHYRRAGLFSLSGCENMIFRNLNMVGPGSIDVGGDDLMSVMNSSTHIWIDHCCFTDGIDGNLDITLKSDFVTISWSVFAYTDRAYDHMNSNLIGSNETASAQGENNLNVTWANNIWGNGCKQRMPMARFGTIHLINNYYNCPGNSAGINARKNSEFLIENNYFAAGVKKIFSEAESKAYNFSGNIFTENFSAGNKGTVTVPYSYDAYAALDVPETLTDKDCGAGTTLDNPLEIDTISTDNGNPDDPRPDDPTTTQSWVFDQWATEGAIPTVFNATFTYDGLTVIYGVKAKFAVAEKNFDDGMTYTHCYDVGGAGNTGSQALQFDAQAGDEITIYSNAGEKGRSVVLYDGSGELLRQSDDIITHTFAANDTYYIYSSNSGIRFYALYLDKKSSMLQQPDAARHIVYAHNTLASESKHCIVVYNMQGICVASGYKRVDTAHLPQGIYIVRCGSETLRIVSR